ncbi:FadR/GntR family transcriptional regulator [Lentibacillus sp. Marseille-P4043]|uniref:FadR/GntR family transcriptional regulator n=1 Tax=Lentibacillus sp. Marseille-P4043 TaxID=2040293 RepID=UPI002D79FF9F|nr:GntR family transcriptional regulator [Lentibacillus sp. Marseille-P4043]
MSPKQKVYQGVLQEIRKFIDINDLEPGDKLPSERELAETLQAGRSSVREALRAMELIGLIETRHGEGTYLSTYRPYQTVELLSSFILRENKTKAELKLAKKIIEKEAAKLAYEHVTTADINELRKIVQDTSMDDNTQHFTFFTYLFDKVENLLLAKIWYLMEEFSYTLGKRHYDKMFYVELVQAYEEQQYEAIEVLFLPLSNSSER